MAGALLGFHIGCASILGFEEGVPGTAGAGASGAGGGGEGGGGCVPSECPSGDSECGSPFCNPDGSCGLEVVDKGTACSDGICDGQGYCVDPSCLDGELGAGETDVDCGGDNCAPCANGKLCEAGSDCATGYCTDEVCCESACDTHCEACAATITGEADGTCAAVLAGTDPNDECGDPTSCEGEMCAGTAGSCAPAGIDVVCRPDAGACDLGAEGCDGLTLACPADSLAPPGTDPEGGCGFASLCDANGACQSMHQWSKGFGGVSGDSGNAVTIDGAGHAIVAGVFRNTADFGGAPLTSAGDVDIFLAKFDAAGSHLWSKRFGDAGDDRAYSVATDAGGNVIVTGYYSGTVDFGGGPLVAAGQREIFLAKYGPTGTHLWSKRFGDAGKEVGGGVAVDGAGDIVLTGWFAGTVDFGGSPLTSAGLEDMFLAKYDGAGKHLWSKRFGSAATDVAMSLAVDAAGQSVVTGYFDGTTNLGGGPLTSAGYFDVYVARYDADGNHLWSKRFGAALGVDDGLAAAVDAVGNAFLTGFFQGAVDFGGGALQSAGGQEVFLAKYDPAGQHLWSKRLGGTGSDYGYALGVDAKGDVFLTGRFEGTADFGGAPLVSAGSYDLFLAKYAPDGAHLWSKHFGGSSYDWGAGLAVDAAGAAWLTGYFFDAVDLGGGPLQSAGEGDIFLAKYGL